MGYENTIYVFGVLNAVGTIICYLCIPTTLNKTVTDEEVAAFEAEMEDLMAVRVEDEEQKKKTVNFWTVLCNKHAFFTMLISFVGTFDIVFFQEWIATNLSDSYGVSVGFGGYMLAIMSVAYLIGCILLPYTCEHAPRKLMFVIAIVTFGVGILLLGPSKLFEFPDKLSLVIASFPILGIC